MKYKETLGIKSKEIVCVKSSLRNLILAKKKNKTWKWGEIKSISNDVEDDDLICKKLKQVK